MASSNCYLNTLGVLCAAGDSRDSLTAALRKPPPAFPLGRLPGGEQTPLGKFHGSLPAIPLSAGHQHTRNNQFALAALEQIHDDVTQAIKRFGSDRVGVIVGTSTSGISDSEAHIGEYTRSRTVPAPYDYRMQEMGATASFVADLLDVRGPVYGISTACSSGAKALASARRLIDCGLCDAVIAGGVDTLCQLTIQGFASLEAVSNELCNPFSRNRNGINIGEGAALFLVSADADGVALLGAGESSDAHHISAPDPSGTGATNCMSSALADASLDASDIDYINLHGTATPLNDKMEGIAVHSLFGDATPCSSTKPYTGHTLGAAGAVEAAICWLAIRDGFVPVHQWDGLADPDIPAIQLAETADAVRNPRYALSNSFAFGGNNISLILGAV